MFFYLKNFIVSPKSYIWQIVKPHRESPMQQKNKNKNQVELVDIV